VNYFNVAFRSAGIKDNHEIHHDSGSTDQHAKPGPPECDVMLTTTTTP